MLIINTKIVKKYNLCYNVCRIILFVMICMFNLAFILQGNHRKACTVNCLAPDKYSYSVNPKSY